MYVRAKAVQPALLASVVVPALVLTAVGTLTANEAGGFQNPAELIEEHAPVLMDLLDTVESQLSEVEEILDSDVRRAGRLALSASSQLAWVNFDSLFEFYARHEAEVPSTLRELEARLVSLKLALADIEEALLSRVTPYVAGDANGDAAVDIADVVVVLQYLFAAGPAPGCLAGADTNADGGLDVSDVVAALQRFVGTASAPAPTLFPELEKPENARCPWTRADGARETVRGIDRCPGSDCSPSLPGRVCNWYRSARFQLVCMFSICFFVPTCEWEWCCTVCADTC